MSNATFETNMQQLDALMRQLEAGELGLEESLQAYEKGMALVKLCQGQLKDAELRVEKIIAADGTTEPVEM